MNEVLSLSGYNIYFGNHWQFLQDTLRTYSMVLLLVDENTRECCLPILQNFTPDVTYKVIEISSGEHHKTISSCDKIWDAMFAKKADRKSVMVNLGGGVIGDMGGFCASTYMRGIDFIQIPTTLLSQVDSSIGGKLGIDHRQIKNAIGLFQNPLAVFINTDFLDTLPNRQLRSGLAEMFKHGLIADQEHWNSVKDHYAEGDTAPHYNLIRHSLEIKKEVVEKDFRESSYRKVLNYGHTLGHAIETAYLDKDQFLLHGEAIAIGMIMEGYLSHKLLNLRAGDLKSIKDTFLGVYGLQPIDTEEIPHIKRYMLLDKKNANGAVQFTLLSDIGRAEVNQLCSDELIDDSIQYYNSLVG